MIAALTTSRSNALYTGTKNCCKNCASPHILGLILAFHISFPLSARKTALVLR